MLPYDRTIAKAGSVGLLLPNLEARLVGENDDDVQSGELWLRGPTVMKVCRQSMVGIQINLIICMFRVTGVPQKGQQPLLMGGSRQGTFLPVIMMGTTTSRRESKT
jgi:acyl-CoA synthetase (AMP-forming)/AMP-acid ligase II